MFTKKNDWRGLRHLGLAVLIAAATSLMILPTSSNIMAATPIPPERVIDPGIGCAEEYWGIKTDDDLSWTWAWGKLDDCTDNPITPNVGGRNNYVMINPSHSGDPDEEFAISWQGIIQGEDPWGNDGSHGGGISPEQSNEEFPTDSTSDYTLKAQWRWTNDEKPNSDDKIHANYLTDLWLEGNDSYMVIDFVWMQLENVNGNWEQVDPIPDESDGLNGFSAADGVQVYQPYCEVAEGPGGVGEVDVFHYNVVLDTDPHGDDEWIEKITNIDDELDEATTYDDYYARWSEDLETYCSTLDPEDRSDYVITGIETGIELSAQEENASGAVKGYFSNSNLYD